MTQKYIRPRQWRGTYGAALLAAFVALLIGPWPSQAQTPACQWYAANATNTLYARADAACRGFVYPGYPPGTWAFHHVEMWSPYGGMCWMRYTPNPDPSYPPQDIFAVAVRSIPCQYIGLCAVYPENKTVGCGKPVADLVAVSKSSSDPTRIFHQNQTCIARKACNMRCNMDNCKWMDRVIPDFANAYLQKTGQWPSVEAACTGKPKSWLSDRMCAESMARYHINNDLLPAMVRSGCGSVPDWDSVFDIISTCTASTLGGPIEGALASTIVRLYRNTIRTTCLAARTTNGLNPQINDALTGKICTP